MPDRRPTTRLLAICVAVTFVSGCESTMGWLQGRETAEPDAMVVTGSAESNTYLDELYRLAEGDPATQAEIYADAEAQATLTPGMSTRLRFALILAAAGHDGSDPARAQTLLRDLLTQPELMSASELALARVFLADAEARVVLETEARRVREEYARAASSEETATARRIAALEAENQSLASSLEEAEAKLEAITSIERSIREQNGDQDPP